MDATANALRWYVTQMQTNCAWAPTGSVGCYQNSCFTRLLCLPFSFDISRVYNLSHRHPGLSAVSPAFTFASNLSTLHEPGTEMKSGFSAMICASVICPIEMRYLVVMGRNLSTNSKFFGKLSSDMRVMRN